MGSIKNSLKFQKVDKRIEHFKYCSGCGGKQTYNSLNALTKALRLNTFCNTCANKNQKKAVLYKDIPYSWFNKVKNSANTRGIPFEITIEYLHTIYIKQNKECSLTGTPLVFSYLYKESNVSIDRINSNKPYVKRNIQLVCKDVNFAKWTFSQKKFIELCKKVAEKHKDK